MSEAQDLVQLRKASSYLLRKSRLWIFLRLGKDSGVILTVWKPTQDIIETWDEGVALSVYHLSVSNPRFRQSNASIKLATNNTTKYQILEKKPSPMYIPRKVHNLESLHHLSTVPYGEVDAVGYIVRIHPMNAPKGSDQIVYIADGTRKLVGVKFRGGIDGFCASSSIKPKSQIAFTNLTWPKCSTPFNNKILFLIFSDLASASCNPKEVYLQKALQSTYMKEYLSFVTEMESELDILLSCEYRTNASITSQKIPSNSNKYVCSKPSPQKTPENQTLTNISNDLPSEKLQKRHKLQIKKRLSLEKYKDPPPLLNLSNKDTGVITAQFKPPKLKR